MKNIALFIGRLITLYCLFQQCLYATDLPDHLVSWAQKNPIIKVGVDATFPPFDYIDHNKNLAGVGKIVRQDLSDILPLTLQASSISDFQSEYNKLLNNNIDAISVCRINTETKNNTLFSKPYLLMTPILVVNKKSHIKQSSDINNQHKIAFIADNTDVALAKQLTDNVVSVKNNIDGYNKLEDNNIDGFITYLYLYQYMIEKYQLNQLIPIAIHQFKSKPVVFCINKNKPELVDIINWGIDRLGQDVVIESQVQWSNTLKTQHKELNKQHNYNLNTMLTYALIAAILLTFIVLVFAQQFANSIAVKLNTRRFIFSFFSVLFLILFLLFNVINFFLGDFKAQVITDQKQTFNITQAVTEKSLKEWYIERESFAVTIAKNKHFKTLVASLNQAIESDNAELIMQTKEQLHAFFSERPFTTRNRRSYTLSDLNGKYLLNFIESAEEKTSTIFTQRPTLFNKVLNGSTVFIPPVWANVDIDGNKSKNDKDPEVFVATPVKNAQGNVIAILALRYDPLTEYSKLFMYGHLGKSAEIYAIDSNGYLLSESRFINSLHSKGVIAINESTILNVRMPNPKSNPIVRAAQLKLNGQNLEGYKDYRGKRVVGQWITFKNFNFTIVSEIDYEEVFAKYYSLRNILYIGLIILAAIVFSLSIFMVTISKRANEISLQSQKELETKVNERTTELKASELKSNLINRSVADGILGVNKKGQFIFTNESATKLLGYSEKEIISKNVMSFFCKNTSIKDTKVYKAIKSNTVIRVAHNNISISQGRTLPVELSISPMGVSLRIAA